MPRIMLKACYFVHQLYLRYCLVLCDKQAGSAQAKDCISRSPIPFRLGIDIEDDFFRVKDKKEVSCSRIVVCHGVVPTLQ